MLAPALAYARRFFENARWLVLNVVLLKQRPESGEGLSLSDDEKARAAAAAVDYAEALFAECEAKGFVSRRILAEGGAEVYGSSRHFRSVFALAADCDSLRSALLARLAASAVKGTVATDRQ